MALTRRMVKRFAVAWFVLNQGLLAALLLGPLFDNAASRGSATAVLASRRSNWRLPHVGGDANASVWMTLLAHPLFFQTLVRMRRSRRFWAALRSSGIWEKEFLDNFETMAEDYPDWTDQQYHTNLRFTKDAFWRIHRQYGQLLDRQDTQMRKAVPSAKRLAMTLHWCAHCLTFSQLALMYGVGKSTAVAVVHDTIQVLQPKICKDTIKFPSGAELEQVCNLAGGALCADGRHVLFIFFKRVNVLDAQQFAHRV